LDNVIFFATVVDFSVRSKVVYRYLEYLKHNLAEYHFYELICSILRTWAAYTKAAQICMKRSITQMELETMNQYFREFWTGYERYGAT
jgi:hypothetical protein